MHFKSIFVVVMLSLGWQVDAIEVDFQSKMPPNWLSLPVPSDEPIDRQLIRKILLKAEGLSYNFYLINHTKAMKLTQERENSCMAGVLSSPERQKLFHYSKPYIFVQGIYIYVLKGSSWHYQLQRMLDQDRKVSLNATWSKDAKALLGLDYERSYGAELDPLVRAPEKAKYLYQKQSGVGVGDLWPMLKQKRVDMILEYPFLLPASYRDLVVGYPVAEAQPDTAAYFACNRGKTGQQIIQSLNKAIAELVLTEPYMQIQLEQVDPQYRVTFSESYRQLMSKN